MISILYIPRSDYNIPSPNSTVTIQLLRGNSTNTTPLLISSVIDQTYNGVSYLSQSEGCDISSDKKSLLRSPGDVNFGCGINYYCSKFTNSTDRLYIRITTSDEENLEGILFDLSIQKEHVPISALSISKTSTITTTTPTGNTLFKPTVAQKHYKVFVGAAGSAITDYANFLTQTSSFADLSFTLTNLKVNGVPASGDQGEWSLNVNYGDISQANSEFLITTDPQQPCVTYTSTDSHFYNNDTSLTVLINGCDVNSGTYYISLGFPANYTASYTYDLLVAFIPIDQYNYIPTYKTLNSGVPVNDVVGTYTYYDAPAQNLYLLNITSANFVKGSYFFVTVFGVDFGSVSFEITQGCIGYADRCDACNVVATCNPYEYYGEDPNVAKDYCKLKIAPCDANSATPYFVSIRANSEYFTNSSPNLFYVDYTIQLDIKTTTPIDISTLTKTVGTGYVDFTYTGKVNEQDYVHFNYNFNVDTLTPVYHLTAHLYVNQEQDEVIFAHNTGSLAGSAPFITQTRDGYSYEYIIERPDSPFDDCYNYDYACNTLYKYTDDYAPSSSGIDSIGSCTVVLPFCELAGGAQYFSVYAVNSSPSSYWGQIYNYLGIDGLGYNRAVDFTILWRLWTIAEPLVSNQVINSLVVQNNQYFYNEDSLNNWYSHHYVYNLPTAPAGSFYDSIRIVIGDLVQTDNYDYIYAYVGCGQAAGDCPCFKYNYFCSAFDTEYNSGTDQYRNCELYVPICECKGPYYVSVRSIAQNLTPHRPTTFTIAAFPQVAKTVQNITLPTTSTVVNEKLSPNNDFQVVRFTEYSYRFYLLHLLDYVFPYQYYYFFNDDVLIYDADLYVLPVTSVTANKALQFTLRYTHTPGKTEDKQIAFLSIGKNIVPPSDPFAANCSLLSCIAVPDGNVRSEGYSYCTILIDPCQFTIGTYYIRTYGVISLERDSYWFNTFVNNNYQTYPNLLDFAGISYTLTIEQIDYNPVSLSLGTPLRDTVLEAQYNHYTIAVPKYDQGYMRIVMYRNSDQASDLTLYMSTKGLAGAAPCYSYTERCQLPQGTASSVCDFYISMCEYAQISGKTLYVSVQNQNINPNVTHDQIDNYYGNVYFPSKVGHVPGGFPVEYTITAQYFTPRIIDPSKPITMTGNVFKNQIDYYQFTVSSADIAAGKILHVEVDSIEPELYYTATSQLKTVISTTPPQTSVPGDCPCSDIIFVNSFKSTSFPCDLTDKDATYYISVKALINGFDAPFDPISYTVKVFYTVPILQTLQLNTPWVSAPHPLNFNEWVIYTIPFSTQEDTLLIVEFADLSNTKDSIYAYGISAFLNFGEPGSPYHNNSLFNYGQDSGCYVDSCAPLNIESDPLPQNTVMCRLIVSGCTQCTGGNYYLTVRSDLVEPEPRIQYRSNYTIRAYTQTIQTLDTFPSNYKANAVAAGGYTFSVNNVENPPIACDSRFYTTFYTDFYFKFPAIEIDQYEVFEMINTITNDENTYISFSSGIPVGFESDCSCAIAPGGFCEYASGCTLGSETQTIYGLIGYIGCDGYISGGANGVKITAEVLADRTYTALPQVTVIPNTIYTETLSIGEYIVMVFNSSSIDYDLLPIITFTVDLSRSGGTTLDRTCISYNGPVVFPGNTDDSSSYCDLCVGPPVSTHVLDGCCLDSHEVVYFTIYNPFGNSINTFTFTYEVIVNYQATSYQELSLPISTSINSIAPNFPYLFSFEASTESIGELNMRFRSSNGIAAIYVNHDTFAHPTSNCADYVFSCLTGETNGNCVIQLPRCYLASFTGFPFTTLYVAVEAYSTSNFVGPVSIDIFYQDVTEISYPSTIPYPAGIVPDSAYVPVNYLVNYKFDFTRTVGDMLLSGNNAAIVVDLIPSSVAQNSLLLSIHDPRFGGVSSNSLAGPPLPTSHPAQEDCDYSHDSVWKCYASNNVGGAQTRNTNKSTGVSCYLYFCDAGVAQEYADQLFAGSEFVYFSVQNTETSSINRTPTQFQVAVSLKTTALPSSEAVYKLQPSHTSFDYAFAGSCSSTLVNSGGCTYTGSLSTAYYLVDLSNVGSWGVNDYLILNITGFNNDVNVAVWPNDQCEPAETDNTLLCKEGESCAYTTDPCQFTSLYRADNGANSYSVQARNYYVRISGLTSTSTFNIEALQVTPLQNTIQLNANATTYSKTFQSWEGRWTMFNFVIPKTEQYDFRISVTSDCSTDEAPRVYKNEYAYQWASEECNELGSEPTTTPFSWAHYACETGGNFFISVYTPIGSVKYPPVFTPEGYLSPQVKFTVSASLTKVVRTLSKYVWEDSVDLVSGIYNFEVIGDSENFGTGISVELSSDESVSLTIISPLYRQVFSVDNGVNDAQGNWDATFYSLTSSYCDLPSCDDVGVYCCNDLDCVLNIPPCEYRNGRYFIIADVTSAATLSSRVYRKDYVSLEVSQSTSYLAKSSGSLPLGPIRGSNVNLEYYQFYKIVVSGDPFFLHVQISANAKDLYQSADYFNPQDYDYNDFGTAFPQLRASLRRGDNGLSTASDNAGLCEDGCSDCETLYCASNVPGTCVFGDLECTDTVYYLGVWFHHEYFDYFSDCDVMNFQLVVTGRNVAPITIEPNTAVCGTVQGTVIDFTTPENDPDNDYYYWNEFAESEYYYYNYFSKPIVDDEDDNTYPYSNTYKVDLTGINTKTADVVVGVSVIASYLEEDVTLSVSTTGPASSVCNDCSATTNVGTLNFNANVVIVCGAFSELWVTVSTINLIPISFDYVVYVDIVEYPVFTPTIPSSLKFGYPSTVNVVVNSANSVIPLSTNNHGIALLRNDDYYISGESVYNNDCSVGCPQVETNCIFLGSSSNYYIYDYNPEIDEDVSCWETPVTSATVPFQVQSVHTLNVPDSESLSTLSSYIPYGGYELIYIPIPLTEFSYAAIGFYFEESIESNIVVQVSCDGFTAGDGCSNNVLATFDSTSDYILDLFNFCGCDGLYLTLQQEGSCGSGTHFTFGIASAKYLFHYPITPLTNNIAIADTLPTFAINPDELSKVYSITSGSDGFLHASLLHVNNTIGPNTHSILLAILDDDNCVLSTCVSGVYGSQGYNDQDSSCFVFTRAKANQHYYLYVIPYEPAAPSPSAAITYQITSVISYINLETTSTQRFQIQGFNRQYFKVNGRKNGVSTGDIQSVVINMQIIDGDRLQIIVSDDPTYINYVDSLQQSSYDGWKLEKACYFGVCTIEISTRAQHPGATVFYVWVSTINSNTGGDDERFEKPTNYKISATTGTNNCEKTDSFISGFCFDTLLTYPGNSVYKYRDASARNDEAEARYNTLVSCKCPTPLSDCKKKLKRFSCLESFRECDVSGFWMPVCRAECNNVVSSCGDWNLADYSCECTRPEFVCSNPRYSDLATSFCTGEQVIKLTTLTPLPSPILPAPSISITPSSSPDPSPFVPISPSASPSLSPPFVPDDSSDDTVVTIYYEPNSSLKLLPNTFIIVFVFVCYLLI